MGNMIFKSTSFYEEKITNLTNSNNALKEIIKSNEKIIKDLKEKLEKTNDILLLKEKLKEKISEHKENIKKLYDNLESNLNHLDDEFK